MGPNTSAAARSAIIMIAVYVLFVAASVIIMNAPLEHRLHALRRSFTEIPPLVMVAIGWISLLGWSWLAQRMPLHTPRSRFAGVSWAVITTLLASAAFVALYEIATQLLARSFFFSSPWRYWLRLFEAALFSVALVRISLPLLPRFDRMPSHTA